MRTAGRKVLAACALVAFLGTAATAETTQQSTTSADELKMAFVVTFIKFVEWPPMAFADASTPFTVGILGEDPFERGLDEAVRGRKIAGRDVRVKRLGINDDFTNVHLLFISGSERARLGNILGRIGSAGALTVSDIEGFVEQGGIIELVLDENRLRFDVNIAAARRLNLVLSSKLLDLAKTVIGN
jgi:hypothetical protein